MARKHITVWVGKSRVANEIKAAKQRLFYCSRLNLTLLISNKYDRETSIAKQW